METPPVTGLFRTEHQVNEAIAELVDAHFDPRQDIVVTKLPELTAKMTEEPPDEAFGRVPIRHHRAVFRGAMWGGGIGSLLGIAAILMTVGGLVEARFMQALVAGPLAVALLEGFVIGAVLGGFMGGLIGLTWWSDDVEFEAGPEQGMFRLDVDAVTEGRRSTATQILQHHGARTRPPLQTSG